MLAAELPDGNQREMQLLPSAKFRPVCEEKTPFPWCYRLIDIRLQIPEAPSDWFLHLFGTVKQGQKGPSGI